MSRKQRGLRLEPFEDRILLDAAPYQAPTTDVFAPELVSVLTNDARLLDEGQVSHIAPRDLLLRFNEGQVLDPTNLQVSIQFVRAGGDDEFGSLSPKADVSVVPGYIGIGENPNEVIVRFAETLPDDLYQIRVIGSGDTPLMNDQGVAFRNGADKTFPFELDLGAQVTAVVPQPTGRDKVVTAVGGAQLRHGDEITITDGVQSVTFMFNDTTQALDDLGVGVTDPITGNPVYNHPQPINPNPLHISFVQGSSFEGNPVELATTADDVAQAIVDAFNAYNAGLPADEKIDVQLTLDDESITVSGFGSDIETESITTGAPIFAFADGQIRQYRDKIVVYFNDDDLPADLDAAFFELIATIDTADSSDDLSTRPSRIEYNPDTDIAILTFEDDLAELKLYDDQGQLAVDPSAGDDAVVGSYRLRVGNEYQPVWTRHETADVDAGDTYYDATNVSALYSFGVGDQPESLIISGSVDVQNYDYMYPGRNDEPGQRDLESQMYGPIDNQDHYYDDRLEDVTQGMTTRYYNFAPYVNGYENLISPAQKDAARMIFEMYGKQLGIMFIEHESAGIQVATADLASVSWMYSQGAVSEPGNALSMGGNDYETSPYDFTDTVVMDFRENWGAPFFGSMWFEVAMHEIGHCLNLQHTYDLPDGTMMTQDPIVDDQVYLNDDDLTHGQFLYRPDSIDIDLYRFDLKEAGLFKAEIFAERQNDAGMLDSQLILFEQYEATGPDGQPLTSYRPISQNDDMYSSDSLVEIYLQSGTYFIGVSASGNDDYDPNIDNTGIEGVSQGKYDLRLDFTPDGVDPEDPATFQAENMLSLRHMADNTGTYFDGDADGVPGGVYNYWLDVQDEARTIYVDKTPVNPTGDLGSITNPFTNLKDALSEADFQIGLSEDTAADLRAQAANLKEIAWAQLQEAVALNAEGDEYQYTNPALAQEYYDRANVREFGGYDPIDDITFVGAHSVVVNGNVVTTGLFDQASDLMNEALPYDRDRFVVRVVGNNTENDNPLDETTLQDNFAYEIGDDPNKANPLYTLEDGGEVHVPRNVTMLLDAGAVFKMHKANFTVGSIAQGIDESGASLQVLGTPYNSVYFTAYRDETIGVDRDTSDTTPLPGDWGGLVFRNDLDNDFIADYDSSSGLVQRKVDETQGVFLNYVNHADIRYGGGKVNVNGVTTAYTPIHLIEARPDITFNDISLSADAAISADPNSSAETYFESWDRDNPFTLDYHRVGPEIHGNTIVNNSLNGYFIRVTTPASGATEELVVPGRWDDTDIVHIVNENIIIAGTPGGSIVQEMTAPALQLLDNTVLQLIDTTMISDGDFFYISDGETTVAFEFNRFDTPGEVRDGFTEIPFDPDPNALGIDMNNLVTEINRAATEFGLQVEASRVGLEPYTADTENLINLTCSGPRLHVRGVQGHDDFEPSYLPTDMPERGTKDAQTDARLLIDPGTIVKLNNTRIETGISAQLIAEGLPGYEIVFTSLNDTRYGAGGTFDQANDTGAIDPAPGNWGGFYFGPESKASLDNLVVAYAGGKSLVGGQSVDFNPVQIRQADARIVNSRFEYNAASNAGDRQGLGAISEATIYVLGAQPIIVGNDFLSNAGPVVNIDVNSLVADTMPDYGRSTGHISDFQAYDLNSGPLVRENRLSNNATNGMVVRHATLTTASVWDDTDMVHVVYGDIIVDNFHHEGGLTLKSSVSESLVVKLLGGNAGFHTIGTSDLIEDRIGGILNIQGTPGHSVILTSLYDDSVGAGFTIDDEVQFDTNNDGIDFNAASASDWRSVIFDNGSHDRNVAVVYERELPYDEDLDTNGYTVFAQPLGQMTDNEKAGDDNITFGFDIHGTIRTDKTDDVDIYSFDAPAGAEVWIDIDYSTYAMDTIVELVLADGTVIARSDNSTAEYLESESTYESSVLPMFVGPMDRDMWRTRDYYSFSERDAGMRVVLPGPEGEVNTFYVRVRSSLGIANVQDSSAYEHGDSFTVKDDLQTVTFVFEQKTNGSTDITIPTPAAGAKLVKIQLPDAAVASPEEVSAAIAQAIKAAATRYGLKASARVLPSNEVVLDGVHLQFNFNPMDPANQDNLFRIKNAGGGYNLQVRNSQMQEIAGCSVEYADIRYAQNGIELLGFPQHSPLLGETGEANDNANNTQGGAQDVGNLAQSDQAAISIDGYISAYDDVDWYKMTIDIRGTQVYGSDIDTINSLLATVFDIDYSYGLVRPDLMLWVYDNSGQLILAGAESNISDDRAEPLPGATIEDLSRGSVLGNDPYIGSISLEETTGNQFYYIAVTTRFTMPEALAPTNPLTRRQPIDSVTRIVEEHVSASQESVFAENVEELESHRLEFYTEEYGLADVTMISVTQGELYDVNVTTGERLIDATTWTAGPLWAGSNHVEDVDIRADGRIMAILNNQANETRMMSIDPGTGTWVDNGDYFNWGTWAAPTTYLPGNGFHAHAIAWDRTTFNGNGGVSIDQSSDGGRWGITIGDFNGGRGSDTILFSENVLYAFNQNGEPYDHPSTADDGKPARHGSNYIARGLLDWAYDYELSPNPADPQKFAVQQITGIAQTLDGEWYCIDEAGTLYHFRRDPNLESNWDFIPVGPPGERTMVYTGGATSYESDPWLEVVCRLTDHEQAGIAPATFGSISGLTMGPAHVEDNDGDAIDNNGPYSNTFFVTNTAGDTWAFDLEDREDPTSIRPIVPEFQALFADGANTANNGGSVGISFTPFDYNLWHQTSARQHDDGHGIEESITGAWAADDMSPNAPYDGGESWYFGLESYNQDNSLPRNANDARYNTSFGNDTTVYNYTYDTPGGAYGGMVTSTFSLADYGVDDVATLYFNYFAHTEDDEDPSGPRLLDDYDAFDGCKIYISADGANWDLIGNSYRSGVEAYDYDDYKDDEFSQYVNPLHEIIDVGDSWRQMRVSLSGYSGMDNLRLRFVFDTFSDQAVGNTFQLDNTGQLVSGVPGYKTLDWEDRDRDLSDDSVLFVEHHTLPDGSLQTQDVGLEQQDHSFQIDGVTFAFHQGYSLFVPNVAGSVIRDQEAFSIVDANGIERVFEFNKKNGLFDNSHYEIAITNDMTTEEVMTAILDAINGSGIVVENLAYDPDYPNGQPQTVALGAYARENRIFFDNAGEMTIYTPEELAGLARVGKSELILLGSAPSVELPYGDRRVLENRPVVSYDAFGNTIVHIRVRGGMTAHEVAQQIQIAINLTPDFAQTPNIVVDDPLENDPLLDHFDSPGVEVPTNDWFMSMPDGSRYTLYHWGRTAEIITDAPNTLDADYGGANDTLCGQLHVMHHAFDLAGGLPISGPLPVNYLLEGDDNGMSLTSDRFHDRRGAADNHYEGFYIDDIIIGSAERGEMVTSSPNGNWNMDSVQANEVPYTAVVYGEYQLEIRRGENYYLPCLNYGFAYDDPSYFSPEPSNDRVDSGLTIKAPAALDIYHGQEFTIYDGVTSQVYRFLDVNHGGGGGDDSVVPVYFEAQDSSFVIAQKIQAAINTNDHPDKHVVDILSRAVNGSNRVDLWGAVEIRGIDHVVFGVEQNDAIMAGQQYEAYQLSHLTAEQQGKVEYLRNGQLGYTVEYVDQGMSVAEIIDEIVVEGQLDYFPDVRRADLWDVIADTNSVRQKGQITIQSTSILHSGEYGIRIESDDAVATPSPGSGRNLYSANDLVAGVTVMNNVIAYGGQGGILIDGSTQSPDGANLFARVLNNTIYGDETATGIGINVLNNCSPTLVNNIVANLATGINVAGSSAGGTVVEATTYQGNGNNLAGIPGLGSLPHDLLDTDPLFVDPLGGNFYLAEGSDAIDSATSSVQERTDWFYTVLEPMEIPTSPLLAPSLDRFGQIRSDDPYVAATAPGQGSQVFKDRGAIDRVDFDGPTATIITPADNSVAVDRDPMDHSIIYIGKDLTRFQIQLHDEGVGINDESVMNTVDDPTTAVNEIFKVIPTQMTVTANGVQLTQGVDYSAEYNTTNNVISIYPFSGRWEPDTEYVIVLNNDPANNGINDDANNFLQKNRNDGTVVFTIAISGLDYGDTDNSQTRENDNGARHVIFNGYQLGDTVTIDPDARIEDGDDGDDGVSFASAKLIAGQTETAMISVTAERDVDLDYGYLHAWFDWDGDGLFENTLVNVNGVLLSEHVIAGDAVFDGQLNLIDIDVPNFAQQVDVAARFRFTSDPNITTPVGEAPDGEVEDYVFTVVAGDPVYDYGDAPRSYGTTEADHGARHLVGDNPLLWIGAVAPDREHDATPVTILATADNAVIGDNAVGTADEDGVSFVGRAEPDSATPFTVQYVNADDTTAYLHCWFDLNGDGTFDEVNEHFVELAVPTGGLVGEINFDLNIPIDAALGNTYSRFRLTSASVLAATGDAPDGEVEDFRFLIEEGGEVVEGYVFEDLDANGGWNVASTLTPIPQINLLPVGLGNGETVLFTGIDSDGTVWTDSPVANDLSSGFYTFTADPTVAADFELNFFGETWNGFYVNSNGCISFEYGLGDFPIAVFPGNDLSRIAPFWADVDLTVSGQVQLQRGVRSEIDAYGALVDRPFVQIDWIDVGTWGGSQFDTNTFSLYIEDNPDGDIVIFQYDNLDWTTGSPYGFGIEIGYDNGDGDYASFGRPTTDADLAALESLGRYEFRVAPDALGGVTEERGMAGVGVYIDANDNGEYDNGELFTYTQEDNPSTPVDERGLFQFTDLYSGTYIVRQLIPDGFVQTTPYDGATPGDDPLVIIRGPGGDPTASANDHLIGNFQIPTLTIESAQFLEGDSGQTTTVQVEVSVHNSFGAGISYHIGTQDGTATVANNDYEPVDQFYTFDPQAAPAGEWVVETLTQNDANDYDFSVSGQTMVYEAVVNGQWELFIYNDPLGGSPIRLTNNATDDNSAFVLETKNQLSVAWIGSDGHDDEIFFANVYADGNGIFDLTQLPGSTVQVTDNDYDDMDPQLSDTHIVWRAEENGDSDIMMLPVGAIGGQVAPTNISQSAANDYSPVISGANVAWRAKEWYGNESIFLYEGNTNTTKQISSVWTTHNAAPVINEYYVAWAGTREEGQFSESTDTDIHVYEIADGTTRLLDGPVFGENPQRDSSPALSGHTLVWEGGVSPDRDIYMVDLLVGTNPRIISDRTTGRNEFPTISGTRVAWRSIEAGGEYNVVYRDLSESGSLPTVISEDGALDWVPTISDDLIIWRSSDSTDYEIVIAHEIQPALTATVDLTIIGDDDLEPDEFFTVAIDGASIQLFGQSYDLKIDTASAAVSILNDDGSLSDAYLMDYGDAPESYGTLLEHNGARHGSYNNSELALGQWKDVEQHARPTDDASGDDYYSGDDNSTGNDENGVEFFTDFAPGGLTEILVSSTGKDGYLSVWLDTDLDGTFSGPGEQLIADQLLSVGSNSVYLPIPANAVQGDSYLRFRLSSEQGLSYIGSALDGEVEDYAVTISEPAAPPEGIRLVDNSLVITGTGDRDTIRLEMGDLLLARLNGADPVAFDASEIVAVIIDGLDGRDSVTVVGSAGDEDVALQPGGGEIKVNDSDFVSISNAEEIVFISGGGDDTAVLKDSPSDDVFIASASLDGVTPATATLSCNKPGHQYSNTVKGVDIVTAEASSGIDSAQLYGSLGNDFFRSNPEDSRLFNQQLGFLFVAKNFNSVSADAIAGDHDVAEMEGDANSVNSFLADSSHAKMDGGGYRLDASGFDRVVATRKNADDTAIFMDTAGDDLFVTTENSAVMTTAAPGGYRIIAQDFLEHHAHASFGGQDQVIYAEKTEGIDVGTVSPQYNEFIYTNDQAVEILFRLHGFESTESRLTDSPDNEKTAEEVLDLIFSDYNP